MSSLVDLYKLGRFVPSAPRRFAKAAVYNSLFAASEEQCILLNTIPKSGTTLVSIVFANYMNLSSGGEDKPVALKDVHTHFVPNSREMLIQGDGLKTPHPFFENTPYRDILYSHSYRFLEFAKGPVIFLYRNPLDFLVSLYFYSLRFEKNLLSTKPFTSPADALPQALDYFADHFGYMSALFGKRKILPVAYENIVSAPQQVFSLMFDWLGVSVNAALLTKSVEFASMDTLRKLEQSEGTFNKEHRPSSMFRSGKIGQWQEHLTSDDVERARSQLALRGISLDRFRLL